MDEYEYNAELLDHDATEPRYGGCEYLLLSLVGNTGCHANYATCPLSGTERRLARGNSLKQTLDRIQSFTRFLGSSLDKSQGNTDTDLARSPTES